MFIILREETNRIVPSHSVPDPDYEYVLDCAKSLCRKHEETFIVVEVKNRIKYIPAEVLIEEM